MLIPKTKSYLVAIKNGEQNVSKREIIFCSLKKKIKQQCLLLVKHFTV